MTTPLDDEVDANFEAFQSMLPKLMAAHHGQYAVLRRRKVESFHQTLLAALDAASGYSDHLFSIQEVTDRAADLGLFSHAINTRLA